MKKPVAVIESPYASRNGRELLNNINYARACMKDSFERGEIPFASHLLYTQPGILDDSIKEERNKGIEVGFYLTDKIANVIAVYTDLGITEGMKKGIINWNEKGKNLEYRTLGERWLEEFTEMAKRHSHSRIWGLDM